MPDLDVDEARKVGVAVPPASKSDYIESAAQLQRGYVATVDGSDPSIGWTVQQLDPDRKLDGEEKADSIAFVAPGDDLPGQVYLPHQLPDPQAAIDAGMAPVKIPAHLITENPDHIQGPEPSERATFDYRDAVRRGIVAHRANDGDDSGTTLEAPKQGSTVTPSAEPPKPPAGGTTAAPPA